MNQCNHGQFTPARIQYLLKEAGVTQRQIAEELGVSEMSVSDVVNFRMVSKRLMSDVARRIGADPRAVFAWYFSQDRPRRPRRASIKR